VTAEGDKAVVRRLFEEVINPGDLGRAGELVRADFVEHGGAPSQAPDLEGFKQVNTMLRAAFPDLRLTVEEMVSEGDRVSVRCTARGTHQGEFWGVPPTGSRVAWEVISIVRVAGGKIAERWSQSDVAGLRQLLDDG
jgi:predicted ester cyclase